MKIAIPVNENDLGTTICVSFGRAPYFLVYDDNNKSTQFISNEQAANSSGGAGILAAQLVVDQGVNALITPRVGENAHEVFETAQIDIYKCVSNQVLANLDLFRSGKLDILSEIQPGHHGK